MADDGLDQLLDEVESKYCQPGTGSRAEGKRCGGHDGRRGSKHPVKIASADDENVDDLIDDILDVRLHEESKTQNGKSTSQQSCKTSGQHPSKKCCPVYLGGSLIPFGIGTSVSERRNNRGAAVIGKMLHNCYFMANTSITLAMVMSYDSLKTQNSVLVFGYKNVLRKKTLQ
ncbi:cilia- and flagella-associated protein 418 isoform X3 [Eleutherodactylus coqui]|uniref:cilia- and flagella-associated protein 418 isoform X3 n=1 Tax=Eleutherodactylus coqui TaxID=57060 RepID=UPI003461F063